MIQARQFLDVNGSRNQDLSPAFCGANAAHPARSINCLQVSEPISNLVGYDSVEIFNGQMNLLNAPWQTIVNANGKVELQNCMSRTGLISMLEDGTPGDYINTWSFEFGTWGLPYYYVDLPEIGEEYADTWCNTDAGDPVPDLVELDPGAAFWLYHGGDSKVTLTFNGQLASGTHGYTLMGGQMNLCGNPYPQTLDLNTKAGQVVITGATSMLEDGTPGDYINTWDFELGTWGLPYYYVDLPGIGEEYADVWCNTDAGDPVPDTTNIPVGSGFWYYACNDGVTLTFINPVAK